MKLRNAFTVPAPPDEVYALLLQLEKVAPCMPGAQLTRHEGSVYEGTLRIKVGPIVSAYGGTIEVTRADAATRQAVLVGRGREVSGQGSANATISASVEPDANGSRVEIVTDLEIQGRVAQFGRGALGDVAQAIIGQFAANLEAMVIAPSGSRVAEGGDVLGVPSEGMALNGSMDLLAMTAGPLLKRAAPVLLFTGGLIIGLAIGRRSRSARAVALTADDIVGLRGRNGR